MARLYANENFPLPVVEDLRRLGHDVLTTVDAGQAGICVSDPEVLAHATNQNRAVLTLNRRHFIRLHTITPHHGGIIVCTFNPDFPGFATRIDSSIKSIPELGGCLLRVYRPA